MLKVLLLLLLTLMAYAAVEHHPFVYEDRRMSFATPTVTQVFLPGRWMTSLTWSGSPEWVHAGNLALHLVNGALVGWLAWQLGIATWWFAAGLFLLHPLNVEAVAYGASRAELLSTLGILVAVTGGLWQAILGVWLALGSKETGVAVVALLLLTALYLGQRRKFWVGCGAAALGLTALPRLWSLTSELRPLAYADWIGAVSLALWRNLLMFVTLRGFSVEHGLSGATEMQWLCVFEVIVLLRLTCELRGALVYGALWFWCALALRFIVKTPLSILPEHQMYLAMVGLCIMTAVGFESLETAVRNWWVASVEMTNAA